MSRFTALPLIALLASCSGGPQTPINSTSTVEATPVATDDPTPQAPAGHVYPEARRGDVVDDYHGTRVADPYRWLEDPDTDESRAWIEAQNQLTYGFLDRIAAREPIKQRLTALWDFEKYGIPFKRGTRYFFSKNNGLQNQSVYYWTRSLDAEPKVLIDPNTMSKDGTVSLSGLSISEDGKYVAYGVRSAGSDWQEWRVREIDTGTDLADRLTRIKFSGASWSHDSKGFYYSRYPEPEDGKDLTGANFYQKVYYHRLGDAQSQDQLIYERPDQKKWGFGVKVTDDGRYLVMSVWKGTGQQNLVYYRDLKPRKAKRKRARKAKKPASEPGGFVPLIEAWDAEYSLIDNDGPIFWFRTDLDAPRGRVIAIDVRKPARKYWKEIIPQSKDTLRSVNILGDRIFATYLKDAQSQVRVYNLKGKQVGDVALPGIGSVYGFSGRRSDTETFYAFTSFTTPMSIFHYDVKSGKSALFRQPKVDFDGGQYEVKQVFYQSKDGTRVPMFIVHKKGLTLDGQNPTYLYGYGGFSVSITPGFSITRAVWMEMGGVLAVPNLRGGAEYGEDWHIAGTKLSKQNVFDDFIAAAEWLIANKYTSPPRLAIAGASNGGLLVGAVMTQRPELFGAALPAVGVMDMLRFHKFTIGWAWVDDYGSSDDPAEFKALHAYSPYHNLKPGTAYPATLVTTADHDDRVVPGHSFKFTAALQRAHKGDAPVMIRIQTKAGHGSGKPTAMRIQEAADKWGFLVEIFGMKYPAGS